MEGSQRNSQQMEESMKTQIVSIIDSSGSMDWFKYDAIGGYNSFISEQKKIPGTAKVTTILFNNGYKVFEEDVSLKKAKKLNSRSYVPRGTTALLDAIGRTINDLNHKFSHTLKENLPDKVIVSILTDGQENSSTKFCKSCINEMITHQRNQHNWEFIFLAANQDAIAEATSLGISPKFAFNYESTGIGTRNAFTTCSSAMGSLRSDTTDNQVDNAVINTD
jgi:hypothetical protein